MHCAEMNKEIQIRCIRDALPPKKNIAVRVSKANVYGSTAVIEQPAYKLVRNDCRDIPM